MPDPTSLHLHGLSTNLRKFNFPSLTRFIFLTGTKILVRSLTSSKNALFLNSLTFASITPWNTYTTSPQTGLSPCVARTQTRCHGLHHWPLGSPHPPQVQRQFTGVTLDCYFGYHAARIHASSIHHLSVTREITKAVVMPNSCNFSGPNGNLSFLELAEILTPTSSPHSTQSLSRRSECFGLDREPRHQK